MDTFELLPSLAQGELVDSSAPELVAAIFRSRASGTLVIEQESEIRVFFRGGEMCGAGLFKGFRTLAVVLLANDWVNALDIDTSRSEAEQTGKRHGEILISRGILTDEQLKHALREQHRQNLSTLLSLATGHYEFRGFEPPPPWARDVLVDPIGCIVEAFAGEQHEERRRKIIEWLGNLPARLSVDWPELSGRMLLGPQDRRAAALLALPRRLPEFVAASRLGQARAEAVLVSLLLGGAVEAHPTGHEEPVLAPFRAPREPVRAKPQYEEPEAVLVEPEVLGDDEAAELVEEGALEDAELAGPDAGSEPVELTADGDGGEAARGAALDAEPLLSSEELGAEEAEAPLEFAEQADPSSPKVSRRWAPPPRRELEEPSLEQISLATDLVSEGASTPLDAEAPLELDTSSAVAQRGQARSRPPPGAMHQSLTFDGSPNDPLPGLDAGSRLEAEAATQQGGRDLRKKLMMQGMRNLGSAPSPAGVTSEAAPITAPIVPAELDESRLGADERIFVVDVRSRLKAAGTQTAYARLSVVAASTSEQIKAAYITAAKKFHPDRSSGAGLAALQPELEKLFALLKEAYDLVATSEARIRYDAALKAGKGTTRKEDAALMLKMGEVLLKKRDFDGALLKLRRAVDLEPTGDTIAALAWGLICDPRQAATGKEEAATLINRALRAPGITARTYYVAGVLWRTKDPESAADAFRKVLELDPAHSDASLELRLLQSRRKGKTIGGGVLSGLLFGKRK